jgi:hypothetical protein
VLRSVALDLCRIICPLRGVPSNLESLDNSEVDEIQDSKGFFLHAFISETEQSVIASIRVSHLE